MSSALRKTRPRPVRTLVAVTNELDRRVGEPLEVDAVLPGSGAAGSCRCGLRSYGESTRAAMSRTANIGE